MTINGPGPIALAYFINTAIDQQIKKWLRSSGHWSTVEKYIASRYCDTARPGYRGARPGGMMVWDWACSACWASDGAKHRDVVTSGS